jgi:hypothetical protein
MASRRWSRSEFTSATHIRTGKRFAFSRFNDDGAMPVCTENLIRVDDVMESPKLAE